MGTLGTYRRWLFDHLVKLATKILRFCRNQHLEHRPVNTRALSNLWIDLVLMCPSSHVGEDSNTGNSFASALKLSILNSRKYQESYFAVLHWYNNKCITCSRRLTLEPFCNFCVQSTYIFFHELGYFLFKFIIMIIQY